MGGEPSGGYGSLIGVLMYNAEPHGTGCRVARVHYNQVCQQSTERRTGCARIVTVLVARWRS